MRNELHFALLDEDRRESFCDLFVDYFLHLDWGGEPVPRAQGVREKLCPYILESYEKGIIRIWLALREGEPIGFAIVQIDRPHSDWCKRPGWGFVREFYIAPKARLQGAGRQLAARAEEDLRNLGAAHIYLHTDAGLPFWLRCGYRDEGVLDNGQHACYK